MPELSENLKRIRESKGLSQAKLARTSGVSQQLISQIERGVNTTTKELPKLASALQVSVSDLDEHFEPVTANAEEEDILARYRQAPPRRKALVRELLRELAPTDEAPE